MLVWDANREPTDSNRIALPPLVPPFRLSIVEGSNRSEALYRSAFPTDRSFRYLKRLKLKTIVSMAPRSMVEKSSLPDFCNANGIEHIIIPAAASQKPLDASEDHPDAPAPTHALCAQVLTICIDRQHLPLLLHDENGAHVCGLVVALLRKLQHFSTDSYVEEFVRFTKYHTLEDSERQFIQRFYSAVTLPESLPSWLWGGERPTRHPTMPLFAAAVSVGLSPEDAEADQDFVPPPVQPQSISAERDGSSKTSTHRQNLARAQSADASAEVLSMLAAGKDAGLESGLESVEEEVLRGMSVEEPSSVMRRRTTN